MTRKRLNRFGSSSANNEGEKLIEMARIANVMLRQKASVSDVATLLKCTVEHCELALQFYQANDRLKLQALVEDWSLPKIKQACPCEGCSSDDYTTVL